MNRIALLVVATGLLLAAAWFVMFRQETSPERRQESRALAVPNRSGRTPAFHVFAPKEERIRVARSILGQMTLARAEVLGELKDDLVLLSREPEIFELVCQAYEERATLSPYEAMAFADFFASVRHPRFVEPVRRLFLHEDFQVRHKGIHAAATQRDQRLTPELHTMYRELRQKSAEGGANITGVLIEAAGNCGGAAALPLLAEALQDPRAAVRGSALIVARQTKRTEMLGRVASLLGDPEPSVRLEAAHALVALGDANGTAALLALLDPREPSTAEHVLAIIRHQELVDARPRLAQTAHEFEGDLLSNVRVTQVILGDKEQLGLMRTTLGDAEAPPAKRIDALVGLAAASEEEDIPVLLSIVRAGDPRDVHAISHGLNLTDRRPPLALVEALIEGGMITQTAVLMETPRRCGNSLLPVLGAELKKARDDHRVLFLIGCLGLIGTREARDEVQNHHHAFPTFVEQQMRLMDLDAIREGQDL
ncbi:MAG TPA: HEAT repeat domain-containing protein [Planctomycetota bacterium]|nr:HEAT repeat domain-containing protein [Planctomycetota bacterium]